MDFFLSHIQVSNGLGKKSANDELTALNRQAYRYTLHASFQQLVSPVELFFFLKKKQTNKQNKVNHAPLLRGQSSWARK